MILNQIQNTSQCLQNKKRYEMKMANIKGSSFEHNICCPNLTPDLICTMLQGTWHCITTSACPQQLTVHYLTSWPPAALDYRRHPCHALFHITRVTETVTPFTAAYLNMTPNNVNNSAICQLVCKVRMSGKNMSQHWHTPPFSTFCKPS